MIHKVKRRLVTCDHYPCDNQKVYDSIRGYETAMDWYIKYNTNHQVQMHYCPEHGPLVNGAKMQRDVHPAEL